MRCPAIQICMCLQATQQPQVPRRTSLQVQLSSTAIKECCNWVKGQGHTVYPLGSCAWQPLPHQIAVPQRCCRQQRRLFQIGLMPSAVLDHASAQDHISADSQCQQVHFQDGWASRDLSLALSDIGPLMPTRQCVCVHEPQECLNHSLPGFWLRIEQSKLTGSPHRQAAQPGRSQHQLTWSIAVAARDISGMVNGLIRLASCIA